MKAAVLKNFDQNLEIEELEVPDLTRGQILVDIKFSPHPNYWVCIGRKK